MTRCELMSLVGDCAAALLLTLTVVAGFVALSV